MTDDPFEAVLAHLRVKRRKADTAEAICPSHDDQHASLSVSRGNDRPVILHCHAGCTPEAVCKALGMSLADLMGGTEHVVATYPYQDAVGNVVYFVERRVPKSFRPRLADGTYARPPSAQEVLFNLPWVIYAKTHGRAIYLVEGERDVETARDFGLIATTAMSGASQPWLPQFSESLAGSNVVIVADNDVAGRARAKRLLEELEPITRSVRAVVPRLGKDLSDHLWHGFGIELLDPLPVEGAISRYALRNVASQPMTWAWTGWIPDAMLSLIEGDPGEGKSVLTMDLAARWSTGAPMPDGSDNPFRTPIRVGLVSAEDDPAKVIRPRFIAAGGNPQNAIYVAGIPVGGRYPRNLDLELDVEAIRDMIEQDELRMLIIDPLMAYLGRTQTGIDNEVRKVLTPLRYIAEETHCGILAVRHLRKAGGKAVHAGGGSIAFTGQARAVLVVGPHPNQPEIRVLAQTKMNTGRKQESLTYRVDGSDPVRDSSPPIVHWLGETSVSASDIVAGLPTQSPDEVRAEVAEEIVALLSMQDMDFPTLRRKLLVNGVESGEKIVRDVLRKLALKIVLNPGSTGRNVVYRLRTVADRTNQTGYQQPLSGVEPELNGDEPDGGDNLRVEDKSQVDVPRPLYPPRPFKVDGDPEVPAINRDMAIECSVCHSVENVLYFEEVGEWRCRFHNPLTYHGESP